MLTKEDIQSIIQAISPLIKAEGDAIRKDTDVIRKNMVTKTDLEINNKVIGTIMRVELTIAIQELNNEKIKNLEDRMRTLEELMKKKGLAERK